MKNIISSRKSKWQTQKLIRISEQKQLKNTKKKKPLVSVLTTNLLKIFQNYFHLYFFCAEVFFNHGRKWNGLFFFLFSIIFPLNITRPNICLQQYKGEDMNNLEEEKRETWTKTDSYWEEQFSSVLWSQFIFKKNKYIKTNIRKERDIERSEKKRKEEINTTNI